MNLILTSHVPLLSGLGDLFNTAISLTHMLHAFTDTAFAGGTRVSPFGEGLQQPGPPGAAAFAGPIIDGVKQI